MPTEIDILRAELIALRAEVRGKRPRRRLPGRLVPLTLVLLLAALTPLSLLAANPFNDLTGGVHDGNIDAIYNAGITTGCVPNVSYCPTANVTRQEMASFLARTAGLGVNPPVANAKTALLAANANTVGGVPANALSRTNGNGNAGPIFLGAANVAITSTTIVVPAAGFVLVSGAVTVGAGGSGFGSTVAIALNDQTTGLSSLALIGDMGFSGGYSRSQSFSPVVVFAVGGPGLRTFSLTGQRLSGSGDPRAVDAIITALYVPFGPGGVQGASSDLPSTTGEPRLP